MCLRYTELNIMANEKSSDQGVALPDPVGQAMRRIQEAEETGATQLDLSKLGLGPALPAGWAGWEMLGRLDKLRHLDLFKSRSGAHANCRGCGADVPD